MKYQWVLCLDLTHPQGSSHHVYADIQNLKTSKSETSLTQEFQIRDIQSELEILSVSKTS
jgi:hypothetical protein